MAAGLGFKTFATGDILTAADANGYLMSQTVMVFADSAARTAAITSPQEGMVTYLKNTDSVEYYSGSAWVAVGGSSTPTFNGVDVYNASNFSVANATDTTVTWGSEYYDTNSYHSTSSNTSRLTIPTGKTGYYLVCFDVRWDSNASGRRAGKIIKNGSTQVISYETGLNGFPTMTGTAVLYLAAGDYLEAVVFQNSGGSLNLIEQTSAHFSLQYMGA